jgi:O-antigen/teichoic acid export membrane protein
VSLIRNTTWSAVAAIMLTGGRFLMTMLLARKLGVSEFGRFAFSQWLVDMVFLSLAFGVPGSASRFFAEFRTQSANLLAFERWFLSRSFAVVAAVTVGSPLVALAFNREIDLTFALLQAGWSASAAVLALLLARAQGLLQFKRVAISNGIYVVIALAGCALLPKEGVPVSSAMLLVMIATAAAALAIWLPLPLSENERINVGSDLNRRMLKMFGMNIWITSLVSALVWSRGEIMIVRTELGVSDVAVYSIALSLTGIATQGVMLLTGAIGPHLTQMWGAGKHDEAINLCRRITDMFTLTTGIMSIFLIAFAPELIRLTFGPAYAEAEVALAILGLGTIGLASAAPNQLLQIKTNGVFARNANFLGAVGLFGAAIPLVKLVGIDGAAMSRVFIQISVGMMTLYFACRLVSVNMVNWLNQAKLGLVIFVIVIFNFMGEHSLYIRALEFCISAPIIVFWLRDDDGYFIYSSLLKRFYTIFVNRKNGNSVN